MQDLLVVTDMTEHLECLGLLVCRGRYKCIAYRTVRRFTCCLFQYHRELISILSLPISMPS